MKKIAILLPYKEIYNNNLAGAASIWVKDYLSLSKLNYITDVYGSLKKNLKPLTKNFKNINVDKTIFSKTQKYINFFYNEYLKKKFSIIEIHNRPEYLNFLLKKNIDSKLIFIFHNNPLSMRGSKTVNERMNILNKTNKILFVSKWTMNKFFEGLSIKNSNNCEILYPAIKKPKKLKKKKDIIVFTGKLNKSKGYDIFCEAVKKILNEFKNWRVIVAGNEHREIIKLDHPRSIIKGWIPHHKVNDLYSKSSISVVPSRWEEPFGRTAMESAAFGCATIISNKGGLPETFKSSLILKKIDSNNLYLLLKKLINNKKFLKAIQKRNFDNLLHNLRDKVQYLDQIKFNFLDKNINVIKNLGPKILHIGNFNEKNNHRLFNLSIAAKISSGLIRNNCDVINFSYRNHSKKIFKDFNSDIIEICKNYKPDLILLGHNNILSRNSLLKIKDNKSKIALWYEDHIANYGPNWKSNLTLIEKNCDLIDNYFITTHPDVIKSKINKNKLNYLPIPVDPNIESLEIYKNKFRYKDLFFALSHGVNFGMLRKNSHDERENFINSLIKLGPDINFHILGMNNSQPKWNYDFYKEIMISKMALNLSRGKTLKYASSNRIASYVGNGILTFINEKVQFQDFFSKDEIVTYKDTNDLTYKIIELKDDIKKINRISKKGKQKYFKIFNNKIVSNFIINKTLDIDTKIKYAWK